MNVTEREMELKLLSLYIKHTVTSLEIYFSGFYFIYLFFCSLGADEIPHMNN